jgi:hypothetical protein
MRKNIVAGNWKTVKHAVYLRKCVAKHISALLSLFIGV